MPVTVGCPATGPRDFSLSVRGDRPLTWQVSLAPSPATRMMNAVGALMPAVFWRSSAVLRLMGAAAGVVLRAGRLRMAGRVPNGQAFIANPRLIWLIPSSQVVAGGRDLGEVGALPAQARLGDFWIPQRGLFAIGGAFFEPFDAERHLPAAARAEAV